MPLGDPIPAFYVGADEYGQRYAYPATEEGQRFFEAHAARFDMSELGWELDTTYCAFDTFEADMIAQGFHWEYDETAMAAA